MTNTDPPAYDMATSPSTTLSGFPTGYFIIENCATGRLLDIAENATADGTRAMLWTPKEKSLVQSIRSPSADNQVFFVDHTSALCSKTSGNALDIDIEGGNLVLRHRKPFKLPFPNRESHPLPQISYSPTSKILRATFGCDPNYPAPAEADPNRAWCSKDYVIAAVPLRRPASFLKNTMAVVTNLGANLTKPLTNTASPTAAAFGHGSRADDFALREHEVMEEERLGGEDDVDDSPEPGRHVRVLELPTGWLEKAGAKPSDKALARRQWNIIPLQTHRRSTSGGLNQV